MMPSGQQTTSFWLIIFAGLVFPPVAFSTDVRRIEDTRSLEVFGSDSHWATSLEFSPTDDSVLIASAKSQKYALIDLGTMAVQWEYSPSFGAHTAASVSPDGRTIVGGDGDALVFLDTYSGQVVQSYEVKIVPYAPPVPVSIGAPMHLRWTRDSNSLLAVGANDFVLFDRASGLASVVMDTYQRGVLWNTVHDIQLSEDERYAFILSGLKLFVFNAIDGSYLREVPIHAILPQSAARQVNALRLGGDGRYTIVTERQYLYVIDNELGTLERRILASAEPIQDVAITQDQCCVLTASRDGTSRIYEIASGIQLTRLDDTRPANQRKWLSSVASPTRFDIVATGDVDGTVRIWRP